MSYITVGVIDYGIGNHASVVHSLRGLGFRVRVSSEVDILNSTDVLMLPGVGAFPNAMQALHKYDLVEYLQERAREQQPIIGICLGMQLLASASHEGQYTTGLNLIPGEVIKLVHTKWHIGWNTVECTQVDTLLQGIDGGSFYFNHSFAYQGPDEYKVCVTRNSGVFPSVIQRGNVIGFQFHPEKSQSSGRNLLKSIIEGMLYA